MPALTIFAPAKLNLFLAVTGRRPDGYHDLVSVAAPLAFGDSLHVEVDGPAEGTPTHPFQLQCDDPGVPTDVTNLILKAAKAFAQRTGWTGRAKFRLEKRIPIGAGLGGGSSDAAAALRALNSLTGDRSSRNELSEIAGEVGSDCALFLHDGAVIMRGRGERVEGLPEPAVSRVRGRRVVVFKPLFPVATAWAYRRLAESDGAAVRSGSPRAYLPPEEAERKVSDWIADPARPLETLLFNNLEPPVFSKFVALPVLLEQIRRRFGVSALMTGSGSACFALVRDDTAVDDLVAVIRSAWGDSAFVVESNLA